MKQAPLIVVIYDGIHNSVFDSQVIQPILHTLHSNPDKQIVLVSFEKKEPSSKVLESRIPKHPSLSFTVCKKLPYVGKASLYYAAYALHNILKRYAQYDLQARGPLAGFICQKACNPLACSSLTIQARGLLAQEYSYEHESKDNGIIALWHIVRQRQFFNLEKAVYSSAATQTKCACTIQAVSKALGEYLISTYDADRSKITIATHDFPAPIERQQLQSWKIQIRNELAIAHNATVYCYNGSIKPWQCPDQVISYFKQKLQENSQAVLYILTQDKKQFESLIKQHALPVNAYHVLCVAHTDIYRYLSAADIGIMFRESHIINWVSRPTKALEYAAAGLKIEHNNTVSWLYEQAKQSAIVPDLQAKKPESAIENLSPLPELIS